MIEQDKRVRDLINTLSPEDKYPIEHQNRNIRIRNNYISAQLEVHNKIRLGDEQVRQLKKDLFWNYDVQDSHRMKQFYLY